MIIIKDFINKYFKITKTNINAIIGTNCLVTEEINNIKNIGKVKINGLEWTARTENLTDVIKKDTIVEIIRIEGVKAIVKPKN